MSAKNDSDVDLHHFVTRTDAKDMARVAFWRGFLVGCCAASAAILIAAGL